MLIAKSGGNYGASAGATITEITGGNVAGPYRLRFAAGDVDTVGELEFEITSATIQPVKGSVSIRPAYRTVDFADGFLTNAKIADNILTAAKFATDSLTADALKADAATEIGAAVWAALTSASHAAGSMGDALLFLSCLAQGNVVVDTIVDGTQAGIVTSLRVRGWLTAGAVGTPGAANNTESEVFRMTKTAVDGGGGTWTSAKSVRNL